jgi:hypothetical protein
MKRIDNPKAAETDSSNRPSRVPLAASALNEGTPMAPEPRKTTRRQGGQASKFANLNDQARRPGRSCPLLHFRGLEFQTEVPVLKLASLVCLAWFDHASRYFNPSGGTHYKSSVGDYCISGLLRGMFCAHLHGDGRFVWVRRNGWLRPVSAPL